jgi:hypothetical protein
VQDHTNYIISYLSYLSSFNKEFMADIEGKKGVFNFCVEAGSA